MSIARAMTTNSKPLIQDPDTKDIAALQSQTQKRPQLRQLADPGAVNGR